MHNDATPVSGDPLSEMAELAGSFIHEIKNHLSTLGLNLQLLSEDLEAPQSQRERRALERIQRLQAECNHLVDVSNDFLRFARVQDIDAQPSALGEVIEELVDFFAPTARQGHIDIKCYLPADLPAVRLDRELFKQALLNVILNAQQSMLDGGQLTIQASASQGDAGRIVLSLIDTGKGMPADVLPRVFRPFFSTKPGGTGLGLATARKIIEAHGGRIDAESEIGKGSKFTITLPAARVD
jgi:signal transduction histidine kinase